MAGFTIKTVILGCGVVLIGFGSINSNFGQIMPSQVPKCEDRPAKVHVNTHVWGLSTKSFILGLSPDRFRISGDEGNYPITCFSEPDRPADIVFVLDLSRSIGTNAFRHSINGMRKFIENGHPDNRYALVGFRGEAFSLLDLTGNKSEIETAIQNLSLNDRKGRTALIDGLALAAEKLSNDVQSQRVAIVFGDGDDNYSRSKEKDIRTLYSNAKVRIYFAKVVDLRDSYDERRINSEVRVRRLAFETRGGVIQVSKELGLDFYLAQLASSLKNEYTIGFDPSKAKGRFRRIEFQIEVPKEFEEIRTFGTSGYFY